MLLGPVANDVCALIDFGKIKIVPLVAFDVCNSRANIVEVVA